MPSCSTRSESSAQRWRVVYPVTGNRDDPSLALQRRHDSELLIRRHPRTHDLRRVHRQLDLCIGHPANVVSGQQYGGRALHKANRARHCKGGVRMIAGHHDDLDARLTAATDRGRDFRSRRILEANEGSEDEVLVCISKNVAGRKGSIGECQHAKPPIGHVVRGHVRLRLQRRGLRVPPGLGPGADHPAPARHGLRGYRRAAPQGLALRRGRRA